MSQYYRALSLLITCSLGSTTVSSFHRPFGRCNKSCISKDSTGMTDQNLSNHAFDVPVSKGTSLCSQCKSLGLSRESFLVSQQHSEQHGSVSRSRQKQSDFMFRAQSTKQSLGSLNDMRSKRDTCALCGLISRSVSSHVESPESAECFISWVKDGRDTSTSDALGHSGTRRLRISWTPESNINECYIVLLRRKDHFETSSDAVRPSDDAKFLGREILELDNQTRIQSWVDVCCNNHTGACVDKVFKGSEDSDPEMDEEKYEFNKLIQQPYFGVIDVNRMMLVSLCSADKYRPPFYRSGRHHGISRPYVALSYMWSKEVRYLTKLSNVKEHTTMGGLDRHVKEMPKAIQDSIELVRRLGYRYLWVDALCIIQDEKSRRSWKLNARHMHLIYSNADLTICAADGTASESLRAMHVGNPDTQLRAKCGKDLELIVTRAPEADIRDSLWNTRAWTFQERLLSRRCLIFANGRVYFQCRSTGMSEAIVVDKKGSWSLDLVDAPLQMMPELDVRPIWLYSKCVPLYTQRNMSEEGDIIAAWEGMQSVLADSMQADILFGLPTSHFDLALLWQPTCETRRPRMGDPSALPHKYPIESDFPSWSWCGWKDSAAYYDSNFLGASLENPNEWLTHRTWIDWHIRQEDGSLKPIWHYWDSAYSHEPNIMSQWSGYNGREQRRLKYGNKLREDASSNSGYSSPPCPERRDVLGVIDVDRKPEHVDDYGRRRRKRPNHDVRNQVFTKKPPQYPFSIVMAEEDSPRSPLVPERPMLQFFTYLTQLYVVPKILQTATSNGNSSLTEPYFDIADKNGDWCGSIKIGPQFVPGYVEDKPAPCEACFIAISEAEAFTLEECEEWTYYIPKDRSESLWDVYFVLLVRHDGVKWTRLGLGKVFKAAFADAIWAEIILG